MLKLRQSSKSDFKYIVNIFGSSKVSNKVSVYQGINYFGCSGDDFDRYADYYHKMINSAIIQTASVSIEAMKGQMCLYGD